MNLNRRTYSGTEAEALVFVGPAATTSPSSAPITRGGVGTKFIVTNPGAGDPTEYTVARRPTGDLAVVITGHNA